MSKVDALLDVVLKTANGYLKQRLLLLGNVAENIDGLLGSVRLQ